MIREPTRPMKATASHGSLSGDRLLIVDDDPAFGALLERVARSKGFQAQWYPSLVEMGSFARIRDFDLAIVDYYLDCLKGDEIAEYVDTFFSDLPVIICSAEDFSANGGRRWPASVRAFHPKISGAGRIIEAAREILDRRRFLKRLAGEWDGVATGESIITDAPA